MGGKKETITQVPQAEVTPPSAADIARQQFALYQSMFPQQSALGEQRASLISQALASPQYMTPEQLSAQQAIRGRETERLIEAMRTRANLGGGLYGGRAAGAEERGVSELAQAYSQQDIANQQNRLLSLLGMAQGISPQSIVPSSSDIYGGSLQAALASQPQTIYSPAQASPLWDLAGSLLGSAAGGFGMGAATKIFK